MITVHIAFEEVTPREIADLYMEEFCRTYKNMTHNNLTLPRLGRWRYCSDERTSGLSLYRYEVEWEAEVDVLAVWGEQNYHEQATIFVGESFDIETPDCYNIVSEDFTPIFTTYSLIDRRVTTRYVPRG